MSMFRSEEATAQDEKTWETICERRCRRSMAPMNVGSIFVGVTKPYTVVTCYVRNEGPFIGVAKQRPGDRWNPAAGRNLALYRALLNAFDHHDRKQPFTAGDAAGTLDRLAQSAKQTSELLLGAGVDKVRDAVDGTHIPTVADDDAPRGSGSVPQDVPSLSELTPLPLAADPLPAPTKESS